MNFEGNDNTDGERCSVSSDNEWLIPTIDTTASSIVGFLTLMFFM